MHYPDAAEEQVVQVTGPDHMHRLLFRVEQLALEKRLLGYQLLHKSGQVVIATSKGKVGDTR